MSVYKKLAEARLEISRMDIKKSGINKHNGAKYYELGDFLPAIIKMNEKLGLFTMVDFGEKFASLTICDSGKPEEIVVVRCKNADISNKGSNAMQCVGAVQTYQRRYLYMAAYEISESDFIDPEDPKEIEKTEKEEAKMNSLLTSVNMVDNVEDLKKFWNDNKSMWKNKSFASAVDTRKKELVGDNA